MKSSNVRLTILVEPRHFLSEFLSEVDSINASGIPTRRPNGMNRYGVILDEVGFEKTFEARNDFEIHPFNGSVK